MVLALTALAACSGGGSQARPAPTSAAPSLPAAVADPAAAPSDAATTTVAPAFVAPLTGLATDDAGVTTRPALVVKISNAGVGVRPQAGLASADLVFEEMVEGGETRFAAVFQSTTPNMVGPVRSARTTDVHLVALFNHPLFAWSGANAVFAKIIRSSPLVDVGFDKASSDYARRRDRKGDNNLFTSAVKLLALAPAGAAPPAPTFQYRAAGEALPAGARAVNGATITFAGGSRLARVWTWDAALAGWRRTQSGTAHVDEDGTPVAPANVVIQFVAYADTGLRDTAGSPVPEAQCDGSGVVWVLTDGHVIEGRWSRPSDGAPLSLVDASGAPIKLAPGRTWVELAPKGSATLNPAESTGVPPISRP